MKSVPFLPLLKNARFAVFNTSPSKYVVFESYIEMLINVLYVE